MVRRWYGPAGVQIAVVEIAMVQIAVVRIAIIRIAVVLIAVTRTALVRIAVVPEVEVWLRGGSVPSCVTLKIYIVYILY